jgi:hypothetical protein
MNSENLREPLLRHTATPSLASVEPQSKPDPAGVIVGRVMSGAQKREFEMIVIATWRPPLYLVPWLIALV